MAGGCCVVSRHKEGVLHNASGLSQAWVWDMNAAVVADDMFCVT
jgi:hypothetical protein